MGHSSSEMVERVYGRVVPMGRRYDYRRWTIHNCLKPSADPANVIPEVGVKSVPQTRGELPVPLPWSWSTTTCDISTTMVYMP